MSKYAVKQDEGVPTDLYIERIEDGKRVADVNGDVINPTAPAYYKIKDELEEVLADYRAGGDEPTDEEDATQESEKVTPSVTSEMPTVNLKLGDKCPDFIAWLVATNPIEAEKRYAGKNIEAYEKLAK